eukprot:14628-Heterococcus_DN1.PRE.1
MSAHEEEQLILAGINKLLERVGIDAKPIKSFEELRKSASSMFVAIFEGMFQVRKEDIVRKPTVLNDYARNAQVVIDALDGEILHMNLDHVTGHAVAKGETVAIRNLVDIFIGISDMVIKLRSREQERDSLDSSPAERARGKKPVPRGVRPKSAPGGTVNASSSAAARGGRKNTARGPRSYPTSTVRTPSSTLRTRDGRRSSKDASKRPAKKVRKKYPRQPMLSQALLELEARKLQEYDNEQQQRVQNEQEQQQQNQQQQQQQPQQQAGGDDDISAEQPSIAVYDEIPAEIYAKELAAKAVYKRVKKERKVQLKQKRIDVSPLSKLPGVDSYLKLALQSLRRNIYDEQKEHADIAHAYYSFNNSVHSEKVRRIRQGRTQESLNSRQAQQKMLYSKLYERAAIAQLTNDACINSLMVQQHERLTQQERSAALKAEERALAALLKSVETSYEERLCGMVDKLAVVEDEKDVSHSQYRQAFAALLNAEDWSCSNYANTTGKSISTSQQQQSAPISAFQARMKH